MRKNQFILMMALMASAGVTVATDQDAAPAALSERSLSDLVQQAARTRSYTVDVKDEIKKRIQAISELSQENVDALIETLEGISSELRIFTRKKVRELCMKILTSNQMGQLLRDCVNGSDQTLAQKKVEMLFTYCDVNITQANLVELAPAMKAFQDHVRADDPTAHAVDFCYDQHYKNYDLRDYYSVWQKKPVDALKSELNILQYIVEDHTVYPSVKLFYKKVQTDLINEILLKDPSFYNALGSEKYSISVKAKKAVDAWEKKTAADKKTSETNKRNNSSMQDLVSEFEKKRGTCEYADAETAFTEKEMSERDNLQKEYSAKSFQDLKTLHKTLCAEKKKYKNSADPYGFYRLRNKWIEMQLDEAETALFEKLKDAKPEDYQTLYDDHYDDNLGFSNKLYSAFEKVTDKVKADLVQTYQNMSDAERSKLEKKCNKERFSTNLMKSTINRTAAQALEKVKKNKAKNGVPLYDNGVISAPIQAGGKSMTAISAPIGLIQPITDTGSRFLVPEIDESYWGKRMAVIQSTKNLKKKMMKKGKPDNDEEIADNDEDIDDEAENEDSAPGPVVKRARSKGPVARPLKNKSKTPAKKGATRNGRNRSKTPAKKGATRNGRNRSKTPAKKGSSQNSTTNVSTQSPRNTVKVKKTTIPVSAE
jgi:hypothetical protein